MSASQAAEGSDRVRGAEVIGALCLATDLQMRFPWEHGLHATLIAMRLAERLEVDRDVGSQAYYACLLSYAGCTADAELASEVFGDEVEPHYAPVEFGSRSEALRGVAAALPAPESTGARRALQIVRRFPRAARLYPRHMAATCEVAEMLSVQLGLPERVQGLFADLNERWDGRGVLGRAEGDEIPLPMRIAQVARDAALQRAAGGEEFALRVIRERAGAAFDPEIVECLARDADEVLAPVGSGSVWEEALACEPGVHLMLEGEQIDRALAGMGAFADLVSPYFVGHGASVSRLVGAAAERCGLETADCVASRRAGLFHDLGRISVPARTWLKPGPLSADEWEQVRLHPYHSERMLASSPFLSPLAAIAGAHHERLDGSGYHRGALASALPLSARLLAVADAYCAMTEPRPHREALSATAAASQLADEASAGRFDADAVAAVLEAAGQPVPPIERPGGLTEREAEVVGLLARGFQTKQIAHALGISVKTADRHIQNAYGKIGVSTRAGAAMFAMEHGLAAWGELPIAASPRRA